MNDQLYEESRRLEWVTDSLFMLKLESLVAVRYALDQAIAARKGDARRRADELIRGMNETAATEIFG